MLRTLRTLRTGRVKKHFFRRNGEESRFPDPRPVPWFARCLPRRSLAEPGPKRPNCRNCPKSSRFPPSALARTSLVVWRMEPPPGRAWGCPPQTPGRGESPAPSRKMPGAFSRMLWNRQRHGGTVRKAFPNPRTGTRSARCPNCPNRPNRPNCPRCPNCSRCPRETCEKFQRFLPEKF